MNIISLIKKLNEFWRQYNINEIDTWDMEMGAATFHPKCFFDTLKNKPFGFSYLQPSRRQSDGKYGLSPNRVVRHHQYQVLIHSQYKELLESKSSEEISTIIQDLYKKSLEYIGFDIKNNDIRFIENNWENTGLGAFGVGWEVWVNGMEITQFTFFTKMADIELAHPIIELAYGIERLALMLNNQISFYDLQWDTHISYKDYFQMYESEMTSYYLDVLEINRNYLDKIEININLLAEKKLSYPMYENILLYNKELNLLLATRSINHLERKILIDKMRLMTNKCAENFLQKYL